MRRIVICVVGDDRIADALIATVGKQRIRPCALSVLPSLRTAPHGGPAICCSSRDAEVRRPGRGVSGIRKLPVLTVSDGKGFAQGRRHHRALRRRGGCVSRSISMRPGRLDWSSALDCSGSPRSSATSPLSKGQPTNRARARRPAPEVLALRTCTDWSQVFCRQDRPRVRLRARERSRRRYGETRRSLGEGGQRGVLSSL